MISSPARARRSLVAAGIGAEAALVLCIWDMVTVKVLYGEGLHGRVLTRRIREWLLKVYIIRYQMPKFRYRGG